MQLTSQLGLAVVGILVGTGLACEDGEHGAPVNVPCPQGLRVRPASEGLSRPEQSWKNSRGEKIIPALNSYLASANIDGFDVRSYIQKLNTSNYPVISLAVSGGGTQSGVGGLGIWQAFDARNPAAMRARTGGITQLLSYISGLSGGGALTVASLAANNFVTIDDLRKQVNFSVDYTAGPSGDQEKYLEGIFESVGAKAEAGFPVSAADAFGQFWATYLPRNGTSANFSDLARPGTAFSRGEAPMPVVCLNEVIPGRSPAIGGIMFPGRNSTNGFNLTSYEITPFEFGSWAGGRVQAFMPTQYLGSGMNKGATKNQCVQGFDKFTFVQGSTADAFNAWFIYEWFDVPIFAKRGIEARQSTGGIKIPESAEDDGRVILVNQTAANFNMTFEQALWARYPNPFLDLNDEMKGVDELLLVDGSLAGETTPIRPLIIPQRQTDLVIVYEASSDAKYSWVNGTNLINSAQSASQGKIPFPRIPDVNTLITRNMTRQPTFFGCDATAPTPLVLYLPNSPWSGYINFTFYKSSFTPNEFDLTLDNAFQLATYGNGSVDPAWPACLACAVVRGSLARVGVALPEKCQECFRRHCWDGKNATREVTAEDLDPRLRLNVSLGFSEWNRTVWSVQSSPGAGSSGGSSGGATPSSSTSPSASPGSGASTTTEIGRAACAVTLASIIALIALL